MSVGTPASVALAATSTALLERESHTAAVKGVLATARADGSAILIFEGPAGSGKSRLLEMAAAGGHERETEIEFGVAWQLVEGLAGRVDPRTRDDLMSGPARGAEPLIADGPCSPAVAEDPLRVQHGVYGFLGNVS